MPWCQIVFAPEMIVLHIAGFCTAWGSYTILTSMPQYMKDVLKFNIAAVRIMQNADVIRKNKVTDDFNNQRYRQNKN